MLACANGEYETSVPWGIYSIRVNASILFTRISLEHWRFYTMP